MRPSVAEACELNPGGYEVLAESNGYNYLITVWDETSQECVGYINAVISGVAKGEINVRLVPIRYDIAQTLVESARMHHNPNFAYDLFVSSDHRNKGLGDKLLNELIKTISTDYPTSIVTLRLKSSGRALNFYTRQGFFQTPSTGFAGAGVEVFKTYHTEH